MGIFTERGCRRALGRHTTYTAGGVIAVGVDGRAGADDVQGVVAATAALGRGPVVAVGAIVIPA